MIAIVILSSDSSSSEGQQDFKSLLWPLSHPELEEAGPVVWPGAEAEPLTPRASGIIVCLPPLGRPSSQTPGHSSWPGSEGSTCCGNSATSAFSWACPKKGAVGSTKGCGQNCARPLCLSPAFTPKVASCTTQNDTLGGGFWILGGFSKSWPHMQSTGGLSLTICPDPINPSCRICSI